MLESQWEFTWLLAWHPGSPSPTRLPLSYDPLRLFILV
ncbi:unnamed protein product [Protopolystoma xenopodis]|uniref:Uncharacterized protein n=1 Tax=Protopolystoma xenopodis TaxID=117903 RepID=A0A3S5FBP7_9PLAT|nr:unnamed protein product [Protopolystoma xenopodis]